MFKRFQSFSAIILTTKRPRFKLWTIAFGLFLKEVIKLPEKVIEKTIDAFWPAFQ